MCQRPLCFILMPFGEKKDPNMGLIIHFDRIYENAIQPGILAAGMEPIRADEERVGGIIHQAMFERLMLCDYAVADLTNANANVFYELGVRHAVRPSTTLPIFARGHQLPFDVDFLRAIPYELGEGNQFADAQATALRDALAQRLTELRELHLKDKVTDSPVFQLIADFTAPEIDHLKTDSFRDRTRYAADLKNELAQARRAKDEAALAGMEEKLGNLDGVESGVIIDLYLSYRALGQWERMVALQERMPLELSHTVLVREQLGFALNRLGRRDEALRVLEQVVADKGPSSETHGLIGRIYKDLWREAANAGDEFLARGNLKKAIAAYEQGYAADFRDAYPGINAVTLLDVQGSEESLARMGELLPVVRFAVAQRLKSSKPDYWDHATSLELAVLADDEDAAFDSLASAVSSIRESWEPETTANNLRLIYEARKTRGAAADWLGGAIAALEAKSR